MARLLLFLAVLPNLCSCAVFLEDFENGVDLIGAGWSIQNLSQPTSNAVWFVGSTQPVPQNNGIACVQVFGDGPVNSDISSWLITPQLLIDNGFILRFVTRSRALAQDRIEVRLNTLGTTNAGSRSTSVGDFTALLTSINPQLDGSYLNALMEISIPITGLSGPTLSRFGFRYYVPDSDINGDFVLIDTVSVIDTSAPEPIAGSCVGVGLLWIALASRRQRPCSSCGRWPVLSRAPIRDRSNASS